MTTRTAGIQFNGLTYRAMATPKIFLDGYEVAQGWGRRVFPSWPGRRRLHVHVRYLGQPTYRLEIDLDIYSGRLVELVYTTPSLSKPASLTYAPRQ